MSVTWMKLITVFVRLSVPVQVIDTLSNAEYNIKYLKNKNRKTVYNTLQKCVTEYTYVYVSMSLIFFTYYKV